MKSKHRGPLISSAANPLAILSEGLPDLERKVVVLGDSDHWNMN